LQIDFTFIGKVRRNMVDCDAAGEGTLMPLLTNYNEQTLHIAMHRPQLNNIGLSTNRPI